MSSVAWHHLPSLAPAAPPDSIVSRTFFSSGGLRGVLFTFAPGQELSEHTAAVPAVLHFLAGEAEVTLGGQVEQAQAGSWAYLPARLAHSVRARTSVQMLLLLLPAEAGPA